MARTSHPSRGPVVRVLGLLLGLGTVAVGIALVRDTESAFGATGASVFVVFGVVVLLSFAAARPVPPRPAPPARDVTWEGEPARFHPPPVDRARVLGMTMLALLGGWFAVLGAVGAVEETWVWAVLCAPPAVYFLGFPVLGALGRFRAGGWWLTPTRVVAEHNGLRSELSLGEVQTVTPWSQSVHLSPVGTATVEHRLLTPRPWRARARSADLVVPAPIDSEGLAALLREAARSASRRPG